MLPYDSVVLGLRITALVIGCGAVAHLSSKGLRQQYRILSLFLFLQIARSASLFLAQGLFHTRGAYSWTWVCTEPLMMLSYVLLVSNLYTLVLQNFKGIQTLGRWMVFIAVPVAAGISIISVLPTLDKPAAEVSIVFYYDLINRGIMFSLVIFILLILFFISRYPVSLSKNVVIHCGICTLFLISASMGYLVRNVHGMAVHNAVNVAHLGITVISWSAWLLLITIKGEATEMVLRREWNKEDEKRLVDQLTAINASLLRASRKSNQY